MNTDEMLKYLGCAVLLVVLIYFVVNQLLIID